MAVITHPDDAALVDPLFAVRKEGFTRRLKNLKEAQFGE
jgi:hypothetical protein